MVLIKTRGQITSLPCENSSSSQKTGAEGNCREDHKKMFTNGSRLLLPFYSYKFPQFIQPDCTLERRREARKPI